MDSTGDIEMTRKTCNEIIDETLAAGYTKTNRAFEGWCRYITPDSGVMCAVGRCCEAPQSEWEGSWTELRIGGKVVGPENREWLLKPEYRGKSAFFWLGLQALHDNSWNWTKEGLSSDGQKYVEELREKWGDQ